jgi:hypothetical protein
MRSHFSLLLRFSSLIRADPLRPVNTPFFYLALLSLLLLSDLPPQPQASF